MKTETSNPQAAIARQDMFTTGQFPYRISL
jgi:hypothetical protein